MSSHHFDPEDQTVGFGTKAIHTGADPERWSYLEVVPPISLTTTFLQLSPGEHRGYEYSRSGNPTRDVLQQSLAALESAKYARVYPSGLAANMAIYNILKTGEHVICAANVYGGTQNYLRKIKVAHDGIKLDLVDLTDLENLKKALRPETRLLWLESPSNPLLNVVDIAEAVKIVKEHNENIIVTVDNTFMSPFFQNPLKLGADIVMHSVTKYINGHTDVLMGAAITNREDIFKHLDFMQHFGGSFPSPFDCYLVIRGIKTLHIRMQRHYENALAVAKFLEGDDRVEKVLYPALESHPQHEIHKKQTSGMSGMVSFYIKGGKDEMNAFLKALRLIKLAASLGGYESLACLPAAMTHYSVPEAERIALGITDNLIRLSIGCEDKSDIITDIDQALKAAGGNH
uniref:cystathionine gamma-lyase n=1 Tax=Panagrellus redivivus TaxID=6233 RepID=A0A7E4WB97_PANRE